MKNIIYLITFLYSTTVIAQVDINKQVQMTGASNSQKQVTGLGLATDSLDAVNVQDVQQGRMIFAMATGTNNLSIALTPALSSYTEGTVLSFIASASNTGPVSLDVNGLGATPVKKHDTLDLSANEIKPGQAITVMYNGTAFEVISRTDPACPNGFVEANSQYCIEVNERTAKLYYPAVTDCYSINARLCTWGEWYYACQKTSLGLSNMTNNWEYGDDTSDHSHTAFLMGNGSCIANTTNGGIIGNVYTYPYRCCFSK